MKKKWNDTAARYVDYSATTAANNEMIEAKRKSLVATKTLEAKIAELSALRMQFFIMKQELDTLKNEIKEFVQDSEIINDEYENTLITYKFHDKTVFDVTKLKEDNPQLYAKYSKIVQERRLQIC